jgi:hypothetical protein
MNRSFSKIRHIQEANQRLEKRLMSEQTQTTVTQTGENPGVKTTTTPPVSNPTLPIPTSKETDTNPFKNPDLLKKFVGKQFNTYTVIEDKNKPDSTGNNSGTFEIKKAYFDVNYDVTFDIDMKGSTSTISNIEASFTCNNPDKLFITLNNIHYSAFAPSLTKELKQTFCTTGAGNLSVPKVDYPTP